MRRARVRWNARRVGVAALSTGAAVALVTTMFPLANSPRSPHWIALPIAPGGMVIDPRTERLFVIDARTVAVSMIDVRQGLLAHTDVLPLPGGVGWQGNDALAVDARVGHVFASNNGANGVSVLSATTGTLLRTIPVGQSPFAVTLDQRSGRAFVITATSPGRHNTCGYGYVSMLDTSASTLLRTLALPGPAIPSPAAQVPCSFSLLGGPGVMAVDEQVGRLFVVNRISHVGALPDYSIYVIDTRRCALLRTVHLQAQPLTVAVDARTKRAFVTSSFGMAVLDTHSGRMLRTIQLQQGASAIAVDATTGHVFVATGDRVDVLNATSGVLQQSIAVAAEPTILAVDARTRRVFVLHDAGDFRSLSTPLGGEVTILDSADGHLINTLELLAPPEALAVDPSSGRVFVAVHFVARANAGTNALRSWWDRIVGSLPWSGQRQETDGLEEIEP